MTPFKRATRTRRGAAAVALLASMTFAVGLSGVSSPAAAKTPTGVTAGKDWQTGRLPQGVSKSKIDALVSAAMGSRTNRVRVRSVLITIDDRIVYERYHPLDSRTTLLDTFSVSKSIVATIIGMLIADGKLTLDQPAPVAAWSSPDDPRQAITIRNLLHMSSGLAWKEDYSAPDSSAVAMLRAPVASDYATSLPLEFQPGSSFEYNSGNTAILMRIIIDTLGGTAATEAYIKQRLLDPLGIKKVLYQRDSSGRIVGFMGINLAARDLARFGLLYLRNGVWGTKTVITPEWVAFSRTASSVSPRYAGHWWTYQDAYEAEGYYGQLLTVSNNKKMVMVINTAFAGSSTEQWAKATGLRDALYALFPAA